MVGPEQHKSELKTLSDELKFRFEVKPTSLEAFKKIFNQ